MKIRIGVGLGAPGASDDLGAIVCDMEQLRFDSLWLSEVLTTPVIDPLAGLAFAAGTVRKLKLGTTLAIPGHNPLRLAKELATIDRLSGGRLLLVMVPGLSDPLEQQAIGVPMHERGAWIEEVLPLLRRLWTEERVEHHGPRFTYGGVTLAPRPKQAPLEMWLGGTAPSALRRAGQLADGWLPSLLTPAEAAADRAIIERHAAQAGRQIDPEHFGVSLGYARERVEHHGPRFTYGGVTLAPRPKQAPLEMWLGGTAPSALRRAGQLADGWLPSLLTPAEAAADRAIIDRHAAQAGRQIDPEHFGVSLGYARERISERQAAQVARRRPGIDPSVLVPIGLDGLRARLRAFIDVGFSKFVVRPSDPPASWRTELRELADAVLPLQT